MTDVFRPSLPEREQVVLALPDAKLEIRDFTEYSFSSNFSTPTDGWSFVIGAERLNDKEQAALKPGALVKLTINDGVQATGYIDSIEVTASRSSGTEWHVAGRDKLAQAMDACADPTQPFKDGQTLLQALQGLFAPFGWTEEKHFTNDNTANRNVKTGALRDKAKRSDAKGFGRKAIKSYQLHRTKAYTPEGVNS